MTDFTLNCPLPISRYPNVVMAHGGGGRLMHNLIQHVFVSTFGGAEPHAMHDAAELLGNGRRLAFTTDAYVVRPLFFPGGCIGDLAVNGTVNDLAMAGARPRWLSAAFVLEEGLPIETLIQVTAAMSDAARRAGVTIVAGDTKVVEHGRCDGMYITTSGVGVIEHEQTVNPLQVRPGDAVLLSGDLARHGIAVMAAREGFDFDTDVRSDCAPLAEPVMALFRAGIEVHCLRDLTRGGLASALVEIAESAGVTIAIEDTAIPVAPAVFSACELLGFDPMQVANEGRFVAFVPQEHADDALTTLRSYPVSSGAVCIGAVRDTSRGMVVVRTLGGERPVDMLSGELLPRIC